MKNTGLFTVNVIGGVLIATGGIALGAGVIVLGAYLGSGELALLGLIPMIAVPYGDTGIFAVRIITELKILKKKTDPSDNYRFVRFYLNMRGLVGLSINTLNHL